MATNPLKHPLFRQSLVAIIWLWAVSRLGQSLTDLGPWYRALAQPDWRPPDWAFGVVWSTIFVLLGIAGVMAWRRAGSPGRQIQLIALLAINSMLHVLWSFLFFTAQRPDWAMIELGFLWLSVLSLVFAFWRISTLAGLLLLPYIVWVTIAGALNWSVMLLNAPFG